MASATEVASTGSENPVAAGDAVAQANETDFPPGMNESGVTDPLALTEAHRQTLENASYTSTSTVTFQRPNGTLVTTTTTASRVASGGESFYVASTQTGSNESRPLGVDHFRTEAWANETSAVVADTFRSEEPTYRQVTRDDLQMSPDTNWELLYSAVGSMDTTYVGQVERAGTTLHKVVSTSPGDEAVEGQSYDFSALVDSDGVVRALQMTQRSTLGGEPVLVTRTFRITQVGDTTVERPDWYGQAVGDVTEDATETETETAAGNEIETETATETETVTETATENETETETG